MKTMRVLGTILFLIGILLGILGNLISGDSIVQEWYRQHRLLALALTVFLILLGMILALRNTGYPERETDSSQRSADSGVNVKKRLAATNQIKKIASGGGREDMRTIRHYESLLRKKRQQLASLNKQLAEMADARNRHPDLLENRRLLTAEIEELEAELTRLTVAE